MTKENKFKIGLALQGIALAMDDKTLDRSKERLKLIEDIIIAEPTGDEKLFDIEAYCKEHFVVMVDKDVWEKAEKGLKQEPKTGHWIEKDGFDGDVYYDCSECGESWTTIEGTPWQNGMNYCPNCGAKMESEEMTKVTTDFAIEYLLDDCQDCPENKGGECMTKSHCFEVKQLAIQALRYMAESEEKHDTDR